MSQKTILMVGLAAVDDDALRPAMACKRVSEEALGRRRIPLLIEPECNRIADAVDGALKAAFKRWKKPIAA